MTQTTLAYKITEEKSKRLADNIRLLIERHNMSENELANEIGIPPMTLWRITSCKTASPGIFILKQIADYFNITLNELIEDIPDENNTLHKRPKAPQFVPILSWNDASNIKELDLSTWEEWYPITLGSEYEISSKGFALESLPSMSPIFPLRTLFIIEPNSEPFDGDMVLIKIKKDNSLTLRKLIINPPEIGLASIVPGFQTIPFSEKEHEVIGVVELTMLRRKR